MENMKSLTDKIDSLIDEILDTLGGMEDEFEATPEKGAYDHGYNDAKLHTLTDLLQARADGAYISDESLYIVAGVKRANG